MSTTAAHNPSFEFIWSQYRTWTVTAAKLKKELTLWRIAVFILTIGGSLTAILCQDAAHAGWTDTSKLLGWVSAAAVGIAGYASSKILTNEKEKKWLQARAAAETCKSHAYLYFFQAPPYSTREDDASLFYKVESLIRSLSTTPQAYISQQDELKGIPPVTYSFFDYLEDRIHAQARGYYFPKAERYRKIVKRSGYLGILLGGIGFLLGSLGASGTTDQTAVWIAFVSTVSASLTTFITANRYEYMAMSFRVTGSQLMVLWVKGGRIDKEDLQVQKDFIVNCEAILSAENEGWLSELSREKESVSYEARSSNESTDTNYEMPAGTGA